MAGIGNFILDFMGQKDPRQALAGAVLASRAGQPPAGGATPAPVGAAPGLVPPTTSAPASVAPPQPEVYQSPPQLLELYSGLQDYTRKANNIDKGIGMIAASFAQPGNRQSILDASQGTPIDPQSDLAMIMSIQDQQRAIQQQATTQKRALAIAEQLGIDPETAMYLDASGELDQLLLDSLKPKDPKTEVVGSDATGRNLIDSTTGEVIQKVTKPVVPDASTTDNRTADIKNYDFYRKEEIKNGREPLSFNDWNLQSKPGTSVTVNNQMGGETLPGYDIDLIKAGDTAVREDSLPVAEGALATISSVQSARAAFDKGIITGSILSPVEAEGRKVLADIFGLDDEAVSNTAKFNADLSNVIRGQISALGTGNAISNADLQFMKEATGSGGTIPEAAIPRILQTIELGSYNQVLQHNAKVQAQIDARGDTISAPAKASLEALMIPVPEISIPADAIAELKADPSAAAEFDEVFGVGAAQTLLMVP